MKFIQKVIKKGIFFAPVKHILLILPSVHLFFYSFSLLKYRYEISIVDISTLLKNIDIDIDIDMENLENIDIDIDIDKAILQNIDIDKISNRFKFGISNRAIRHRT